MAEWFSRPETRSLIPSHPPLYPLFLGITYLWPNKSVGLALFAQALVSACAPLLTYKIAKHLAGSVAGHLASLWVVFDPFLIYFSALFLSETLFVTLLLMVFACFTSRSISQSPILALTGGLFLGLASLCRSILLPLALIFPVYLFILARRFQTGMKILLSSSVLIGVLAPVGIWSGYVRHRSGTWILISVQKGWATYEGLNPDYDSPDKVLAWQKAMSKESLEKGLSDPLERDKYFWEKSKKMYLSHPVQAVKLMMRKFMKFWRIYPYFPYSAAQRVLSAVYMVPLLFFAGFGLARAVRARTVQSPGLALIVAFVLSYSLLSTFTWVQIRYRVPLHPLVALWAAAGLNSLLPLCRCALR